MTPSVKDIRLHMLVKYIIKEYDVNKEGNEARDPVTNEIIRTVRYEFTVDNLRKYLYPWYYFRYWFFKPTIYETNYFCRVLSDDNILVPDHNIYGQYLLGSYNLENAREAYFGKKYLDNKAWVIAIYVSTILNAFAAIALVVLTFFADRSNEIQLKQSKEIQLLHEQLEEMKQQNQLLESQMLDSLKKPSLHKN